MTVDRGPVLLYDGTCGFCHASVHFVLRHDKKRSLRFASLGGEYGRSVIEERPDLQGIDSVVWWEPATSDRPPVVLTRSAAALRIAQYLGGAWSLMRIFTAVPRPIRDRIYDLIARHRQRLLGSAEQCITPPADSRDRFLDKEP
jgi:predicted DCC family thiol-disulfide oxidoreductase YuxK